MTPLLSFVLAKGAREPGPAFFEDFRPEEPERPARSASYIMKNGIQNRCPFHSLNCARAKLRKSISLSGLPLLQTNTVTQDDCGRQIQAHSRSSRAFESIRISPFGGEDCKCDEHVCSCPSKALLILSHSPSPAAPLSLHLLLSFSFINSFNYLTLSFSPSFYLFPELL